MACGAESISIWLPLGAGGHSVRLNGLLYEAVLAAIARRRRYDLYHWRSRCGTRAAGS